VGLGFSEVRRAKLRFGLLTAAVSLLVFLVLLLTTLAGALVGSLTGALAGLQAQGLAYAADARDNIVASRLDPDAAVAVAAVPGVAAVGSVGTFTTRADIAGAAQDLQVFGFEPDAPGAPGGLSAGRLPAAEGETAIDGGGVEIGDTIVLQPGDVPLTVVGQLRGAQFNAIPTAYVVLDTYGAAVEAANPGLPFVPVNAVAFDVVEGSEPEQVAAAVTKTVPGVVGYTRDMAVDRIPGISSITQSFGILVGLTFIIGIVVIGFFFLILTVQKLKSFTLLRAIGTPTRSLAATVALQISLVVIVASALAVGLTLLAVQGLNTGIPVQLDPVLIVTTVLAVLVFSLLAGLLSIRRISRIDPATAVGAR
jgi:hemin transport system permease protein